MKIAQIAPLMESVPPRLYGGTERIVAYLTDELVRLGHEVTLFASADSVTAAKLVSCASMALRLDSNVRDTNPYYMLMLDRVRKLAEEFDILHFHIDQFHFPLFHQMADRTVTTLHGRQDLPDLKPLYIGFSDMPLVSISSDLAVQGLKAPAARAGNRQGRRSFDRGDAVLDRLLHLFKRAHLDLTHALAGDAEFGRQVPEDDRIIRQPARLENAPLSV